MLKAVISIIDSFGQQGYVADEELATILYLAINLKKPLLLEGNPGVGKTQVAKTLAAHLGTDLIRLQCYEGLDVQTTVYEWNYQKQLLSIKIQENNNDLSDKHKEEHIFTRDYLLERPLLTAISAVERPPVLLIDEIDRADEEFEAFLLELLSEYQISIPEIGTVKALHPPIVILTSNGTRELGDALKRRCLFHWIEYPDFNKELSIVKKHLPGIDEHLADQLVEFVQQLRQKELEKVPGISETIDWATGLIALGHQTLNEKGYKSTIGCLLKSTKDIEKIGADQEMIALLK